MSAIAQHDLQLTRPLAFFDLETTGINTQSDRIIEIAVVKCLPQGNTTDLHSLLNPEIPIPAAATAVHGITDADVALAPTFARFAPRLIAFLDGCDLSGFNVRRFDLPLLLTEFQRCGMAFDTTARQVIDVQTIFHRKEPRDLSAALRFYCKRDHVGAHGAMADVRATVDIFRAQLQRYEDLPRDVDELATHLHPRQPGWADDEGKLVWDGDRIVLAFGKHRGEALTDVIRTDREYIQWILSGGFSESVKHVIRRVIDGQVIARTTT
ncbi:MAG: 3'-5' exonuclease [Bacteroidota bacterium]|jgi:DNA polymerase-3 subunit epsilon|nr:3'-5' exonuclease [Bacteroidota bacterium]